MHPTLEQTTTEPEKSLQSLLDQTVDGEKVFGTSFAVKKDALVWQGAAGNLTLDQPYFIASTTKLFTTAIILQLKAEGTLRLEDKISKFLDQSILSGLHIYHGKDHSPELRACSDFHDEASVSKFYFNQGRFCSRMRAIRRKI